MKSKIIKSNNSISGNPESVAQRTRGVCDGLPVPHTTRKSVHSLVVIGVWCVMTAGAVFRLDAAPAEISNDKAVRAIVGEAANQGRCGMLAVAGAIRNRGTLRGVYGVKNPIADKQPAYVWQRAREAWAMSATNDITRGATHWENTKAFGKPYWASSLTITTNIGCHTFYR
jgi:hypothetical protein